MTSFAAQLVDMFYGLVERVTGYGARGEDDKGAKGSQALHDSPPIPAETSSCDGAC